MTNAEWLESKSDEFIQKSRDWIYNHMWIPIIILAIFIAVTIYVAISIDALFIVFLYPLGVFEGDSIAIAVYQWLDKEHKEK